MELKYTKIFSGRCSTPLKVVPGHFATNHSHTNYYVDMTTLKSRMSEAKDVAATMAHQYVNSTIVDTIICLDGTEVIGAYMAEELTNAGIMSMNAHQTIYIVTPEFNTNSQMIFRENNKAMIEKKNVILLLASVTSGLTVNKALESVLYYGGVVRGISAVFSALDKVNENPINAVFTPREVRDYQSYDYRECPYCKQGKKLDALVNSFGYSLL